MVIELNLCWILKPHSQVFVPFTSFPYSFSDSPNTDKTWLLTWDRLISSTCQRMMHCLYYMTLFATRSLYGLTSKPMLTSFAVNVFQNCIAAWRVPYRAFLSLTYIIDLHFPPLEISDIAWGPLLQEITPTFISILGAWHHSYQLHERPRYVHQIEMSLYSMESILQDSTSASMDTVSALFSSLVISHVLAYNQHSLYLFQTSTSLVVFYLRTSEK